MGKFRSRLAGIACISTLAAWAEPARATDCGPADVTVGAAGASVGSYNPFGPTPPKIVAISISTHHQSEGTCDLALSFGPSASPSMGGASTFRASYTIEAVGGGATYVSAGTSPSDAHRIDLSMPASGGFASRNVQVRVLGDQVVADGVYVDSAGTLSVFNRSANGLTLIKSVPFPVSATVAKVCQLSQPSAAVLDFTPAISNGHPNADHVLTSTFSNVSCTAPTTIRLSGDALRPAASRPAPAGLDSFINWQARAHFGGASAVLSTSSATEAVSNAKNVVAGPTVGGSIELSVNLLADRPLMAGAYSGTLTISLDPDL